MILYILIFLPGLLCAAPASAEKTALIFQNRTADDISISIEEACLPVLDPEKTHRLPANGRVAVRYDSTISSCVVLVPVEKELGVQASLFTIEPKNSSDASSQPPRECPIKVFSADATRRTYRISSTCVAISG